MIIIFFFFVLLAAHGVRQLFEQMKLLIRYVFNFDKDSQTISQQQQQQLRHFCVSSKMSKRKPKLITVQENQMCSQRNKFHCSIK